MIVIFAIFLTTAVTNSQEKHIQLLSNDDFQGKLARRVGRGDDNNEDNSSKETDYESNIYIGNRDDKSYIPEIDLALTDIYLRSYTDVLQENSTNDALNKILLPLREGSVTIDDNNKSPTENEQVTQENNTSAPETPTHNTKEDDKVNQEKDAAETETPLQNSIEKLTLMPEYNPLEPEIPIRQSDYEHSDTEHITEGNEHILSTILTEVSVIPSTTETYVLDTPTANIEAPVPENHSVVHVPEIESTINYAESSSKATESHTHGDDTLIDENTTHNSVIDTTTNENVDIFYVFDSQALTTPAQNPAAIEDHNAVTENILTNEHLVTIKEIIYMPEPEPTKKPNNIINTVINAVNEIEDMNKSERCLYCHRVYELLWPNQRGSKPFLRSQAPKKNQIHFIPVHKYLRNFETRNYKDRRGINIVNKKTTKLSKRQIRQRYNDRKYNGFDLFNANLRKFGVYKRKDKGPKTIAQEPSEDVFEQYERKAKDAKRTKEKGSNTVKLFDDTNNDILPALLHVKLGAENVGIPTVKTNKDLGNIDKYARLDNLFDFISVTDSMAAFNNVNIRKMSNSESEINIYTNVLRGMIIEDNNALKQYDWLATTVQIQSALAKILKLINRMRQSELIHPADLQILKYIVLLHNLSLGVKEQNRLNNKLRKRVKLLSRNKKKKKYKLLKENGLINRVWLYLRTLLSDLNEEDELSHLHEFLIDVQDRLLDLHEAIRHIADITKFDRQNWFSNLKQLYLSTEKKHLRELLLHISMSRLIDLLEHSSKQGLDDDVVQYLKTNEEEAVRIVEEMLFIDKIVDDIEINTS